MKFLRKIFDNAHHALQKSEKTKKYFPLVDAVDTLMFTPKETTKNGAHIRDSIDLKRTMMTVIIALIPCLLFGMWNVGHQHFLAIGSITTDSALGELFFDKFLFGAIKVLPVVIVSYGVGLAIEFIFCIKNGHAIQEGFLVSGMLIPLIMPVGTPLWMIAVATIFAVLIGKEVFGGTGMNILNIALTARAFLFFAYPTMMSGDKVWVATENLATVDGFSGATALGHLATTIADKSAENVQAVTSMFTDGSFYSLGNSILGAIPGSIGETSVIMCLLGAALLIWTGIGSWRIMLSMFIGGWFMAYLFNLTAVNAFMEVDPMHQLMLGGFMFGLVFMATDPVTAAQTNTGKYIYGFLAGVLAILIRVVNPAYPEGVMLAILFMNVMAPLIDHYVIQANIKRRINRVKVKTA